MNRFKEIFFPECANSRQRADGSQVCYLKGPNGVSYTEALEFCQKQGMVLAEIKTPSELENVVAFATVTNNYTQPSKYNAKVPTKKFFLFFVLLFMPSNDIVFMSPVSPVFHIEVRVSIGLKTKIRVEHPFHNIRCPCWLAERSFMLPISQVHILFNALSLRICSHLVPTFSC